ncbi:MAG: C4-dicarboxylate ABC transporter substrate-binding protein [Burkholderiaceae bacterium]|nr:C4-dicarboxylate ABC transporter substrate-binding protein [Burkholderiaceae bacterium]
MAHKEEDQEQDRSGGFWANFSLFGANLYVSLGMVALVVLGIATAAVIFFSEGTPSSFTIASGPAGSSFERYAEQYKKILARQGITLKIVHSDGSFDNLHKLNDPKSGVDVAFVLGGDASPEEAEHLFSLGSVSYQPLLVFYRGKPKALLSEFDGMRIAIGEPGSGAHVLALNLLKANGIEPGGKTQFVESTPAEAVASMLHGKVDVLFVMSDSASMDTIHELIFADDVHLFDFTQADAYARKFAYLNKLSLPRGSLDFGRDLPPEDAHLVGPMVELVARSSLHPTLSDFLIEAAREVHGKSGMFKKSGEFPALLHHDFPVSPDAERYYSSGKSYLYRTFPFWLARLINRVMVAVLPVILILIPGLRIIPGIYRWRMQGRIYRWYRELLELEREVRHGAGDAAARQQQLARLAEIEDSVRNIRVPATFADLFYSLREHIFFVRERVLAE